MSNGHGEFTIVYPVSEEMDGLHISIRKTSIRRYGKKTIRYIPVPCSDPEICRQCTSYLLNEDRNDSRRKRCMIINAKGNMVRCYGNCGTCTREYVSSTVSLDHMTENGFDIPDSSDDPFSEVDDRETLRAILDRLEEIKPRYAYLLRRVLRGESGRSIARSEGMSCGTINEQIERAKRMAADIWNEVI